MKKLFALILITSLASSVAFSTGNPVEKTTILKSEKITVTTNSSSALFSDAFFNEKDNSLEFKTEVEINFVQIFNTDGEMEFQLPTMSKNVKIGMSFFEEGDYKLGFIIKGKDDITFYIQHLKNQIS